GDLPLALGQRRLPGGEVLAERGGGAEQLRVVHPYLVRAGQSAARALDQEAIAFLLLGGHLVDGNLGVTSERRGRAHRCRLLFALSWLSAARAPRRRSRARSARPGSCDSHRS